MNDFDEIDQLENQAKKFTSTHKALSIIVSIIMIIGGIFLLINPIKGLISLEYIASGVFCIFGIFLIYKYFSTPKDDRLGWTLVNGIIVAILGVLYIFSTPLTTMLTFSFIFAVLSLSEGINTLVVASKLKKQTGAKTGGMIFLGILNILISIFFVIAPLSMNLGIAIIIGIYFIVGAIILLAGSLNGSNVSKS